jgi:hypothetical protein
MNLLRQRGAVFDVVKRRNRMCWWWRRLAVSRSGSQQSLKGGPLGSLICGEIIEIDVVFCEDRSHTFNTHGI